jgi:hypothetical protein
MSREIYITINYKNFITKGMNLLYFFVNGDVLQKNVHRDLNEFKLF